MDIAAGPQLQLEPPQPPLQKLPSPAQLESLYAAASSGDLPLLKRLFRNALERNDVEQFNLANDASTRTGFTALHVAASRGYLEIVQWRKQPHTRLGDMQSDKQQLLRIVVLCLI